MAYRIESLERLTEQFARIPGIGKKTAQRMAFSIISLSEEEAAEFASAIIEAKSSIHLCPVCQALTDEDVCSICSNPARDRSVICVLEDNKAFMSLERVRQYNGLYHVLHGVISPMKGITPDKIKLRELIERIDADTKEIIVATNPTVEGETTAMYISRLVAPLGVKVTRLAYGIPVGGDLEFADEVTLHRAIEGRRELN